MPLACLTLKLRYTRVTAVNYTFIQARLQIRTLLIILLLKVYKYGNIVVMSGNIIVEIISVDGKPHREQFTCDGTSYQEKLSDNVVTPNFVRDVADYLYMTNSALDHENYLNNVKTPRQAAKYLVSSCAWKPNAEFTAWHTVPEEEMNDYYINVDERRRDIAKQLAEFGLHYEMVTLESLES